MSHLDSVLTLPAPTASGRSTVVTKPPAAANTKSSRRDNADDIAPVVNDEYSGTNGTSREHEVADNPAALPPMITPEPETANHRPPATTIILTMTPLCFSVLLSSLDLTIVTPAIPAIVSSFDSVSGYVWIGTAFILASTGITPVWGAVADIWGRRPIILIALTIFLGGSLLCALAPTMDALIAGRTVQGLGASGMGTMVNVIICDTFSLRDRGLYLAITSIVWAAGSAVGPIIGGLFTTKLRLVGETAQLYRFQELRLGQLEMVFLDQLSLPSPNTSALAGLKAIDWSGGVLIVGAVLMVLLGLEFGGVTFPWSSATVITLIALGVAIISIFVLNEWKVATNPIIPLRLFSNRSSVAAYGVYACIFYVLIGLSYYLPLYSQSVLGADALTSGLHLLPLIVSCSLAAACVGAFIQQTGIYLPVMYIAQCMMVLGSGLFLALHFGEGLTKMLVFEVIVGIGVGMNIEPPVLAAQAALTVLDTAAATATMSFIRSIATATAVVVGVVIFQARMSAANEGLVAQLNGQQDLAHSFDGDHAAASVGLIGSLPADLRPIVRRKYFDALSSVFIMFVAAAGLSLIANMFVRAQHLSTETGTALLGVDRTMRASGRERPPRNDAAGTQSSAVELSELRRGGLEEGMRERS
ncbi:MAG: hypothetical protein Q9227_009427 [Pyrenula ochraceoflavens]